MGLKQPIDGGFSEQDWVLLAAIAAPELASSTSEEEAREALRKAAKIVIGLGLSLSEEPIVLQEDPDGSRLSLVHNQGRFLLHACPARRTRGGRSS